jgi:hypothetical protein
MRHQELPCGSSIDVDCAHVSTSLMSKDLPVVETISGVYGKLVHSVGSVRKPTLGPDIDPFFSVPVVSGPIPA